MVSKQGQVQLLRSTGGFAGHTNEENTPGEEMYMKHASILGLFWKKINNEKGFVRHTYMQIRY